MPTAYRHANKRVQFRARGGRFRSTTLADVGLGGCERCHGVFVPDFRGCDASGFIDPAMFRERQRVCPTCLELPPVEPPTEPQPPTETGTVHGQYGPRIEIVSGSCGKTGSWRWCASCGRWEKAVAILAAMMCPGCSRQW